MIKNLSASGPFLKLISHGGMYVQHPYGNNAQSVGMMRFNTNNQSTEVYDGNTWVVIGSNTEVVLTDEANELLMWAREQKRKQEEIEEWATKHPTVAAALSELQKAQQRLHIVTVLCKEEESSEP